MPKANKELVLLEYSFFFDPKKTWANLASFERDFEQFLRANNLKGDVIKNLASDKRIIYVYPDEDLLDEARQMPKKEAPPGEQVKKLKK